MQIENIVAKPWEDELHEEMKKSRIDRLHASLQIGDLVLRTFLCTSRRRFLLLRADPRNVLRQKSEVEKLGENTGHIL